MDICFENMFSHPVGCFFLLLMVSFAVQTLFSLTWSHLFVLLLLPFGGTPKKRLKSGSLPPTLSPRNSVGFDLIFKSLMYSELLFAYVAA